MNELTTSTTSTKFSAKHKVALKPHTHETGRVEAQDVDARTALIPKDDCNAIVSELTAALEQSDVRASLVFAKKLIGCYRMTKKDGSPVVVDIDIYIETMASKFAKYPPDISQRIIDEITDKQVFPPAPAEVVTEGDRMLGERRAALYTAKRHLEERERRRKYFEGKEQLDADRVSREAELEAQYKELGWEWNGYENASWVKAVMALGAKGAE